jgi:hypothetical protein
MTFKMISAKVDLLLMTYFCQHVQASNNIQTAFLDLGKSLAELPEEIIHKANIHNQWFTSEFILLAAQNWHKVLNANNISTWLNDYPYQKHEKTLGIIMAGNIPFVGLHDLLCGLALGFRLKIKLSSHDEILMKYAIDCLCNSMPELKGRIQTDQDLHQIDGLIATGSNNSSRYFDYYFKDKARLIRKGRTSVAVLSGKESEQELLGLADDIYSYFGLGCRNVTHLLLPKSIALEPLYMAYDKYMQHVHHHKYYNNYMYHKSILLMNLDKHYDNGFMLFQEKRALHAPIATLNYHYYESESEVNNYLEHEQENIQCVVSHLKLNTAIIPFGHSQMPALWDYADNINTLEFLKPIIESE